MNILRFRNLVGEQNGFTGDIWETVLLPVVGTVKKVLDIAVVSYTLIPMVKTCAETGVINELVIKCVRWAIAHPGAFYIYENFFKNFLPEPNFGHQPFGTMDEGEVQYPAASYGVLNPRGIYAPLRSVLNVCHWHTAPPNSRASTAAWLVARGNKELIRVPVEGKEVNSYEEIFFL